MTTAKEMVEALKTKLQYALPGEEAHLQMMPKNRKLPSRLPQDVKEAAVVVALFLRDNKWHTMFILRSTHELDKHRGQISFPGGRIELGETKEQAALRELWEETGVTVDQTKIIGRLTPIYVAVSNFKVYPFVVQLDFKDEDLSLDSSEVDAIYQLPISQLLDTENLKCTLVQARGLQIDVPAFGIGDITIWGATAMILNEFLIVYKSINHQ